MQLELEADDECWNLNKDPDCFTKPCCISFLPSSHQQLLKTLGSVKPQYNPGAGHLGATSKAITPNGAHELLSAVHSHWIQSGPQYGPPVTDAPLVVVDVGVGIGCFAMALLVTGGIEVHGFDNDPSVVDLCHDWHDAAALVAHPTMGAVIQAHLTVTLS